MTFEFFDNKKGRYSKKPFVSVDKYGRLSLNSKTREMLQTEGFKIELLVAYDKINKRIGLTRPEVVKVPDAEPMTFDKRGYGYARNFFDYYRIPYDKTARYYYVGQVNGIYAFQLEGFDAPDAYNVSTN